MLVVYFTQEVIRRASRTESARGAENTEGNYIMMTEQAKAAQRAYKAAWRAANPDKVKQQQERYWEKRAAQQAQEKQHAPTTEETQEE